MSNTSTASSFELRAKSKSEQHSFAKYPPEALELTGTFRDSAQIENPAMPENVRNAEELSCRVVGHASP